MKNRTAFLSVALLSLFAWDARASSIVNLDGIPYDFEVTVGGSVEKVSLAPNQKWQTNGWPIEVRMGKDRMKLDANSEYAIWKGGVLTRQRGNPVDGRL